MESQFGIAHVWAQGDFVSRSVAILLLLMSVASWAVIIIKALALVKMKKYASKAEGFWHSEDFGIALDKLGTEADNPFRIMALEGREAVAHHRKTCAPPARHAGHQRLDHPLTALLRRWLHAAPAVRPVDPGLGGLNSTVRRSVRHGAGASTTRWWPLACRASRPSTRSPAPWARR